MGTYPDYLELRGGEGPPKDPHEGSLRLYADADQELRTIKSDGTDAPVGAPRPGYAVYSGTGTLVNNADIGHLKWNVLDTDVDLLDATDPLNPTVLADGFYLVSAAAGPVGAMTAGGWYELDLILDVNDGNADVQASSPSVTSVNSRPRTVVSAGAFIPQGGGIVLTVDNEDGVQDLSFALHTATIILLPG